MGASQAHKRLRPPISRQMADISYFLKMRSRSRWFRWADFSLSAAVSRFSLSGGDGHFSKMCPRLRDTPYFLKMRSRSRWFRWTGGFHRTGFCSVCHPSRCGFVVFLIWENGHFLKMRFRSRRFRWTGWVGFAGLSLLACFLCSGRKFSPQQKS